jgi:predicted aminopeptidase
LTLLIARPSGVTFNPAANVRSECRELPADSRTWESRLTLPGPHGTVAGMAERQGLNWSNRIFLLPLLGCLLLCGCETARFYKQAAQGQFEISTHRQPIGDLIRDSRTEESLRQKLQTVLDLRNFADRELHLPIDGHYLHYVDLHRRFVVWNVHAAPEFSLKPKAWFYPFLGRLTYRGYFTETNAREYAERLSRVGYDVYVEGVETYSTLGWFKDPVLNTFVHHRATALAEILFHELAHQKLFIAGNTDFNEAFATAVAEEGVRRWLSSIGDARELERYELATQRQRDFMKLVAHTRLELEALYQQSKDPSIRRAAKVDIISRMRNDYATVKQSWNGYSGYDSWFSKPVNNAQLNSVAEYYDLVPKFERLLHANTGNLRQFYRAARRLGKSMPH